MPVAVLVLLLSTATVQGFVRSASTHEPIAHAVVEIAALERRVAVDERGYFVIPSIPAGRWSIRVSALGYRPTELDVTVPADGAVRVDVALKIAPLQLEEIDVRTDARAPASTDDAGPPPIRVDGPVISTVPGLIEADVFRVIQTLPAVAAASDFSSALYVRGGSPDQNLILLDGAPVFNPFHAGGLFAAFDPGAIAELDILPGAFPASVGDRLSSVVSVRTRDGGRDRLRGWGGIGLVSSRAGLDGPLPDDRGSYLVSVRRTYLDLMTDAAKGLGLIDFTIPYGFTDAHLKAVHDVGGLGSIAASVYLDREGLDITEDLGTESNDPNAPDQSSDWGSYAFSLRYRQPLGATVLAEARAALSSFYGSFGVWERRYVDFPDTYEWVRTLDADTRTRDLLIGADLTWYARRHRLGWGVQMDRYTFDHRLGASDLDVSDLIPSFRSVDRPTTIAAYIEDEWSLTADIRLRGGVRALHAEDRGTVWLPRLGARVEVTPDLTLTLGAGRYAQILHSLRDEEAFAAMLTAYDLLAAVPARIGLSTGRDIVLGGEWRRGGAMLRVDGYLKQMQDLPLPAAPPDALEDPILVTEGRRPGTGTARGIEALFRYRRGRTMVALGYALSSTELEVAGSRYAPHYDRRHTLDLSASTSWGEHGLFSARIAWATGQPYTPVVGIAETFSYAPERGTFVLFGTPSRTVLLGPHNAERLPSYFRLDVAVRKDYEKHWFGADLTLTPYFQILNVLNTKNVLYANPDDVFRFGRAPAAELEYLPQLPFLPTFGIEWRF
ncbi:MAG TPA: TonB-dependent receptor [Longimicrobiales bacterium]